MAVIVAVFQVPNGGGHEEHGVDGHGDGSEAEGGEVGEDEDGRHEIEGLGDWGYWG